MNNRVETIDSLLITHQDAFFIFSNGLTAREASFFCKQSRCLYMLHAMGESLSVGIGLAVARPDLQVVVVEGDGNALMGLSAWSMMPLPNIVYYILQNHSYETTGGQLLPDFPALPEWCNVIQIKKGKSDTPNPPLPKEIWNECVDWLSKKLSGT
jgi:thiamine pyrophosphate-dependent acetolactate synthase large subunit-like protein